MTSGSPSASPPISAVVISTAMRVKRRPRSVRAGAVQASSADGGDRTQRRGQALRPDRGGRRARPRCAGGDLPRPARPQRRRQVDDDAAADRAGDRRWRRAAGAGARAARRVEVGPGRNGRRPPARQPRRRRHRRRQPRRLRAALPGQGRRRRRRPLPRPGPPARPPQGRRRRALRWDAAATAAGPRPRPRTEAGPARRADRRPRPADPDRALDPDRGAQIAAAPRS